MEWLDRGVVAVKVSNGVFLSWRLLGTDPQNVAFNIYRNGTLVNGSPLTDVTNYVDTAGSNNSSYEVKAVVNGREEPADKTTSVWAQQSLTINLNRPNGGSNPSGSYTYSPGDASVGDLDGDGEYEIILKWDPSDQQDNSNAGYTGNVLIDAYKLNGQHLWRIDLGRNIRAGAHYTQFLVYDFDSDGKAEVVMKTADGTRDAGGTVIGNANADYRNSSGYVLSGPEYLTVFNGQTGRIMQTINYPNARGNVGDWGDTYGNRVDRFLAGVAYLDGQRPSMIFSRGYYAKTMITALDWRNGQLSTRWTFTADANQNQAYRGQGAHSLSIADVDNDGKHEIIFGAATIDDNGRGLYNTNLGHGDALHVADIIPSRPGLEVFMVHECPSCYGNHGVEVHDARTGQILYSGNGNAQDVGRGVAGDIDPRYPGMEVWASRNGLFTSTGQELSTKPSQMNFMIWWDGDLLRELLDGTTIYKWNYQAGNVSTLFSPSGVASNNGTKSNPALSADIFGDWREEIIFRNSNNTQLVIYTTTIPTDHRLYTLMHDPQYRAAIAWQNVAYNQPPHPSFFLGDGMAPQPIPDINTSRVGSTIQSAPTNEVQSQK
jgi:rhamnogalacturonan endolyase